MTTIYFSVPEDWNVWVVGDKNQLASVLHFFDSGYDALVNILIVEVVFGLVNQERIGAVEHEDRKYRRALLTGRKAG